MFTKCFFDPDNYLKELLNGYKFIISGRKGDGKSAFSAKLNLLEEELKICTAKRTINHFNNITFKNLETYKNLGGNPYISFWKCIIMIEAVKLIDSKQSFVSVDKYNALVDSLQDAGLLENEDISRK